METIKHDLIYPNPNQPRKTFHPGKLAELAQSITNSGLMEPLVVVKRGKQYMIIAGERRWRACKLAGLSDVPVRIMKADDQTVAELSLIENLQREDLNVIEIANAYRGLLDMGLTKAEIAQKMGHTHVWLVDERLSLLNLGQAFQEYTVKNVLSPAQAFQLSRLPKDAQGPVFDKISSGKINSYEKLKSHVNAILYAKDQASFIPEPTGQERETVNKYDRMIDNLANFIIRSFNREDLTVLSTVLTPSAKINIERIDSIIYQLTRIKRALLQSDSAREVLEQVEMAT